MRPHGVAVGLVLGALAAAPATAAATEFTVNSTEDEPDQILNALCDTAGAGIECTLRAAVQEANATIGADVILLADLGGDYDLTEAGAGEDAASTGDLDVTRSLTIQGSGQPVIDGIGADRVLHVGPSNAPLLTLDGLEVRGGGGVSTGAGIRVDNGSLSVTRSTIAGNQAENLAGAAEGAGVHLGSADATHTFASSTINGNVATGQTAATGGGVNLAGGADASFANSTISLNTATSVPSATGGGVAAGAGSAVNLAYSTLHQNSAFGPGGFGGSLVAVGGVFTMNATIISSGVAQIGSQNCSSLGGAFSSLGSNLEIPATPGNNQCGLGGGDRFAIDSGLSTLGDRGGPTQTHALLGNSVALEAIPIPSCLASADQRGEPRPSGAACDIGAFERQVQPPAGEGCFGRQPTIIGTPNRETLIGGPGADVILGEGANDLIKGRGGNDLICGGKGSDRIYGGAGNDRLAGEDGKDRIFGQAGDDALLGNAGRDVLSGGGGRDSLNGGGRRDNCRGGRGDKLRNC